MGKPSAPPASLLPRCVASAPPAPPPRPPPAESWHPRPWPLVPTPLPWHPLGSATPLGGRWRGGLLGKGVRQGRQWGRDGWGSGIGEEGSGARRCSRAGGKGLGAQRRLFPARDRLVPTIRPPRCPLQPSLLRDLMMHPHSPGRRGARFPPIPQSLMALCHQLMSANPVAPALTHGWTPHVQPRWPHAKPLHQGTALAPCTPSHSPGAAAHGAAPRFIGGTHEEAVTKDSSWPPRQ